MKARIMKLIMGSGGPLAVLAWVIIFGHRW
jgi:hypothetical protein